MPAGLPQAIFAFFFVMLSIAAVRAAELVMFEAPGCEYCELWNEEVGEIYAETDTGRSMPLRRVQIEDSRPSDLRQVKGIRYSPTFVVIDEGREVGRIIGYTGEAFFWGYLEQIAEKLKTGRSAR